MNMCRGIFLSIVALLSSTCSVVFGINDDKWWENKLIYEIYPQSFYDYDGDGLGDLKGIQQKVPYLHELGVSAVWITPFLKSPLKDNGYDISDFKEIDPRFGTMRDFKNMVAAFHDKSIKIIIDFVPNHTSDEHEWFEKSVREVHPYNDYYIWADPKEWKDEEPVPPNNWASEFTPNKPGSAWKWNGDRRQFYYHSKMVEQPDLNLRNPRVINELKDILTFWLDKGVGGVRFDSVTDLFEDISLRDEEPGDHSRTKNLPETYEFIEDFRAFLDDYGKRKNENIFMTTEAYCNMNQTLRYYGEENRPGAHFPFNFLLLTDLNGRTSAKSLNETISNYLSRLNSGQNPNWVTGNHDWPRITSRMGSSLGVYTVTTLALLLPGTAIVFMGDEINMDSYWKINRDKCPPEVSDDYRTPNLTPFHWSSNANAGFTSARKPWIPINPEYYKLNVADESYRNEKSPLNHFKEMVRLRKEPAFRGRNIKTYVFDDDVFAFTREGNQTMYVIQINLSKFPSKPIEISDVIPEIKRATLMDIPVISDNNGIRCNTRVQCAKSLMKSSMVLPPQSASVFKFAL